MGNENSKNTELTENGNIPGKHGNGSVNGLSANITSNGLEIAVNTETIVQQNGEPLSLELATESTQLEILETIIHKNEVKKGNEDQTDLSLPATNPQQESASSGEEAAMVTVTVHREDFQYPQPKTEISTQTDGGSQADISTQTGEDDDDTTTTVSSFVMDEEAVEDTAYDEPRDNQTAGNISEEMVMENVYRAEWAEVTGVENYNPEEKIVNGREETELEIAAEPESIPKESIIEDEIDAEENNIEEPVPLEVFYSLPKVVADCVKVVFAAISESTDSSAVNTSDRSADEVITEDNGEGAGDMSAHAVLIKTADPESNAGTPEASGANGVPSPGQEPATTAMETISEVVREEPNPTPVNQDVPVEELSVPLVPVRLVAHEKVSADDAFAVEDIQGIREQGKLDDERECDRCPEEEMITVEAPPDYFIVIEELPEDTESMPEVVISDENAEVGLDAITYVGQDTFEEAELSPFFVKDDAELTLEAAIDALSLEFESIAITPPEPAVDDGIPLEEDVITARTFVPLFGELVTENIVEEAANVPPTDAAEESEPCVSV
ncbi:hypothetical protein EPR50_G00072180 [Perca flavescens]|uniref:Uncharacterized protein n=1 Tax=Perca flavescens TaxID=8167 RepID=A0A484D689_PERFV|nr:hypothetical protein EPR50_G00072180 [Perca flavescens]